MHLCGIMLEISTSIIYAVNSLSISKGSFEVVSPTSCLLENKTLRFMEAKSNKTSREENKLTLTSGGFWSFEDKIVI